jgi:hypothetical protein
MACLAVWTLTTCTTAPMHERPQCSEEVVAEWEIPAVWYLRSLTTEQAYEQVLTGNLGIEAVRDRWQALNEQRREGDQYWRYYRPEGQLINDIGWQEGVVLNRGCLQLGFVTTSMQAGEERSPPRS